MYWIYYYALLTHLFLFLKLLIASRVEIILSYWLKFLYQSMTNVNCMTAVTTTT